MPVSPTDKGLKTGILKTAGCTNGPDAEIGFTTTVRERRDGVTPSPDYQEFPPRQGRRHQVVVPLYVGYDGDAVRQDRQRARSVTTASNAPDSRA